MASESLPILTTGNQSPNIIHVFDEGIPREIALEDAWAYRTDAMHVSFRDYIVHDSDPNYFYGAEPAGGAEALND